MTAIDLSLLPPPDVVEPLDSETILQAHKDDLLARDPDLSAQVLESDPITKVLEVNAYRELALRQRVNDAARATMLAFALDGDLDQLAADFNVERMTLDPGDPTAVPPIAPTMETNDSLRRRRQLAPEGLTTAGSDGSYKFNALSASETPSSITVESPDPGKVVVTYVFDPNGFGAAVKDASITSAAPGDVLVTVLSHDGDGTPDQATLNQVSAHLSSKYVRPLTDNTTIAAAAILNYSVTATIHLYDGPDTAVVDAAAQAAFWQYATERHALGEMVTSSGIDAALQVPGVQKVVLAGWADKIATNLQAPYCTALNLTVAA